MQPEAINRHSTLRRVGPPRLGPAERDCYSAGSAGLAWPAPLSSPSRTLAWSDFSVWSVPAWAGPATYFSSLLLLVLGCVGVSPVGSTWSRLRDLPRTGVRCVEGVAPCFLCRFTALLPFFDFCSESESNAPGRGRPCKSRRGEGTQGYFGGRRLYRSAQR